jgi:hypothetical protein
VAGTTAVEPAPRPHVSQHVRGSLGAFPQPPGSSATRSPKTSYPVVLERYNTVLDELFTGLEVFVVTMDWSCTPTGPAG